MEESHIDWNDLWNRKKERSSKQFPKEKKSPEEAKKNALLYLKGHGHGENMEELLQSLPLSPEIRVLDIGPGPGNMVLPMAPQVAHITAIEPDDAYISVLRDQIAERGITNIIPIQMKWEDVDIARDLEGQYDLVIASQSLHMPDIKDAITKMCAASRKWVYLFWAAGISPGEKRWIELWPKLFGREYYPGPKADILYNLLYDMGIYPNVKSEHRPSRYPYPDNETAIQAFLKSYKESTIPGRKITTPEQEKIVREYYSEKLEQGEGGYFVRNWFHAATFWWDVSDIHG